MSTTINPIAPIGSDSQLITELNKATENSPKQGKARKCEYQVWGNPQLKITGWKFNEFDYGRSKVSLASNARGLFSLNDKIVIRGYDKFFNIKEMPNTKWPWLEENSIGPYYVTLKENGCIVFISGLEDGTLIVTSKNSTGPREDVPDSQNHSYIANKRVQQTLTLAGHTEKELANDLYKLGATLVGELCDDNFEEHILPYNGDKAGIYIHGLNVNCPKFISYPFEDVEKIADKYGFLKTKYTVYNDILSLREFLESCAETGSWNDTDVEGFVIRCKIDNGATDFFFKYKFEQPYLMYRGWREATKKCLRGTVSPQAFNRVTRKYLDFALPILLQDAQLKDSYLNNHGIIRIREQFLDHVNKTGMQLLAKDGVTEDDSIKFVLVTVATLGCGKTTLALALEYLTGWGHIQNDNVSGGPKKFVAEMVRLLDSTPAVIADRNNHKRMERGQLLGDISSNLINTDIKYICLNFIPNGPAHQKKLWSITRERISRRGENHQTIRNMDDHKIDMIMKGFIDRFEPVDVSRSPDELFDYVIDLDIEKGTRYNLELVIDHIYTRYPDLISNKWTIEELNKAMDMALNYKPIVIKKVQMAKPVYFCIDIQAPINQYISQFYAENPEIDSSFWQQIVTLDRVQPSFHVTLVHRNDKTRKSLFNSYKSLFSSFEKNDTNKFGMLSTSLVSDIRILSIAHDRRALALEVQLENSQFTCGHIPHITIGTKIGIQAVASGPMLLSPECIKHEWNIEPKILKDMKFSAYFA